MRPGDHRKAYRTLQTQDTSVLGPKCPVTIEKPGDVRELVWGGYLRRTMSVRGNNVLHSFAGREDNELMIY